MDERPGEVVPRQALLRRQLQVRGSAQVLADGQADQVNADPEGHAHEQPNETDGHRRKTVIVLEALGHNSNNGGEAAAESGEARHNTDTKPRAARQLYRVQLANAATTAYNIVSTARRVVGVGTGTVRRPLAAN